MAQSGAIPSHPFQIGATPWPGELGFHLDDDDWLKKLRAAEEPVSVGKLGPYELLKLIGRGGQGVVYKTRQPGTGRIIAVKRVTATGTGTSFRVRFEREARTAAALNHPNIVKVFACDTVEGQPLLLMEYIDGVPLDEYIRNAETSKHRNLETSEPRASARADFRSIEDILDLFAKVCEAVAHAHQRGVIHRDLKPSNVLVTPDGEPHVLDFGLSRLLSPFESDSLFQTFTTGFVGTPVYASPEHFTPDAAAVDVRSDVYSVGVMLYQALTGRLPYACDLRFSELMRCIQDQDPPRPTSLVPDLPREAELIVLKALAKDREQRYPTMEALAQDLRRYLAGEAVLAHPPSLAYQLRKTIRRHKLAFASAAVIAVLLVAFAITSTVLALRERAARNEADQNSYVASVSAASASLRVDDFAGAQQTLDRVSTNLRNWEWRYLRRLSDQSISTIFVPDATSVAVGPDGSTLLNFFGRKLVEGVVSRVEPSQTRVLGNDCGRALDHSLRWVWYDKSLRELGTDRTVLECLVSDPGSLHTAFGPNGELALGDAQGRIYLFSAPDLLAQAIAQGEPLSFAVGGPEPIARLFGRPEKIVFTPDGQKLAVAGADARILVVDVPSRNIVATIETGERAIWAIAFDSKGTSLVSGSLDKRLTFWDLTTLQPRWTATGHTEVVRAVDFSSDDNMVASAAWDKSIRVWNADSGAPLARFMGHTALPYDVQFLPSGRELVSLDGLGDLKKWRLSRGDPNLAKGEFRRILALAQPPHEGRSFLAVWESSDPSWRNPRVSIVDPHDRRKRFELHSETTTTGEVWEPRTIAISSDSQWIAVLTRTGAVLIWRGQDIVHALAQENPSPPAFAKVLDHPSQPPSTVAGVVLWGRSFETTEATSLSFDHDGRRLAVGRGSGDVEVWDVESASKITTWPGPTPPSLGLCAFIPKHNRVLIAYSDGVLNIRDAASGKVLASNRFEPSKKCDLHLRLSQDGTLFTYPFAEKDVQVVRSADLSVAFTLRGHNAQVADAAFSPDGTRIATAGYDNVIKLWDAATGREVATLHGHLMQVNSVLFTPDGKSLISGGSDNTIRFWDSTN